MPRVSIILPIYNGERTLRNTLDSLLNQTYQDFELLACIDGSEDGSMEIHQSIGDPRLQILRNERNLGLARTLNRLMTEVNEESEFVAMAEQDDFYYTHRLEKQVEFLVQNPDYGLVSGVAEFFTGDESNITLFQACLPKGESIRLILRKCFFLTISIKPRWSILA